MAVRQAERAGVGDDRRADPRGPRLGCRIGQPPAQAGRGGEVDRLVGRLRQADLRQRGRAGGGGQQETVAGAQVAASGIGTVGMQHEVPADRDVTGGTARTLVGRRSIGARRVETIAVLGQAARDARIDDVDDTADRRRSEQQRRWPAQHLDPFGQQRIDDDRMIDRRVRHVDRSDAVGQDAHAIDKMLPAIGLSRRFLNSSSRDAVEEANLVRAIEASEAEIATLEAAQDRSRRAGAERGRRHAGLAGQRFADGRAQVPRQLGPGDDRGALQHVGFALEDRRGDDDVTRLRLRRGLHRRGLRRPGLHRPGLGEGRAGGEQGDETDAGETLRHEGTS